jgi:transposase
MSGWPPASDANLVRASSTGSRSRPRTRGLRGFDAPKQVKSRKRHLLVDTLGLILTAAVTAASVQDRDGAKRLLEVLQHKCSRWRHSWADGVCAGPLIDWARALLPQRTIHLETTKRLDSTEGFVVIPKRWIVERTLGWFNRYRRLSKDNEYLPTMSEAMGL